MPDGAIHPLIAGIVAISAAQIGAGLEVGRACFFGIGPAGI